MLCPNGSGRFLVRLNSRNRLTVARYLTSMECEFSVMRPPSNITAHFKFVLLEPALHQYVVKSLIYLCIFLLFFVSVQISRGWIIVHRVRPHHGGRSRPPAWVEGVPKARVPCACVSYSPRVCCHPETHGPADLAQVLFVGSFNPKVTYRQTFKLSWRR